MLGCFNPNLGHIWTNPAFWLIFKFGFVHILPKIGLNQHSIFLNVYKELLRSRDVTVCIGARDLLAWFCWGPQNIHVLRHPPVTESEYRVTDTAQQLQSIPGFCPIITSHTVCLTCVNRAVIH